MNTMTIQQIADIEKTDIRTIQRWMTDASAHYPELAIKRDDAINTKKPAALTLDEVCAILEAGGESEFWIALLRENAGQKLKLDEKQKLIEERDTLIKSLPPPVSSMLSVSQYVEKYHPQCPISSEPLWLNCLWRSSMAIARERGMAMAQTTKAVRSISVHESDVFPEEIIAAAIASYTSENWRAIELNKDDVKERIAAERRTRNQHEEPEESPYWI